MRHVMSLRPRRSLFVHLAFAGAMCFTALPMGFAQKGGDYSQQAISPNTPSSKQAQRAREAAQLRMLLSDMTRPIGPSDEALEPLKEKLSKVIKVQFLDTPLERVVEFLQRDSGVTMLIDRNATAGREEGAVALEADKMTIKEAIDWACLVTDTDWDVIKGVVVVSTSTAIQRRQLTTKVYDVKSLLIQAPNFTGAPEFDLNSALSNTSSGGSSGGAQSATTLFSDDVHEGSSLSRFETIEQLVTLIQDTIGRQSDWSAYGGELYSIREINGNLIIKTSPRYHKEAEALLKQFIENQDKMVSVDARYVLVKTKVLEELIKKNDGDFILTADKVEAFMKAATDPASGSKRLGSARMIMFNGQRTHLTASNTTSFLSDLEPVSGGDGGVDPTQSVLFSGSKIDVEATLAQEGKAIVMTLRGEVVTGTKFRQTPIPSGGVAHEAYISQSGKVTGTVEPTDAKAPEPGKGDVKADVQTSGSIKPGKNIGAAYAQLDLPEQDGVGYRTSVSIPNGGAVLLTGASSMIKSVDMEDSEIVLIVRARSK